MTSPDDFDIEFEDYTAMDRQFYTDPERTLEWNMQTHSLWPRIEREGWTNQFEPDVYLYKNVGGMEVGIWPEYQFDFTRDIYGHTQAGWRVVVNAEGIYWKKFDTLGDALDSVRDRNYRGYERLLPDPSNDEDSDYERVLYGFAVANGRQPE